MKNTNINQLPLTEFEKYGLVKDGKINLPEDQLSALKSGKMTDLVELKNLSPGDYKEAFGIETMQARLSIVNDGTINRLRVDPVYKDIQAHPLLSDSEQTQLINGEVSNITKVTSMTGNIVSFGPAAYQFNSDNEFNFFLELAKPNGKNEIIWGNELQEQLTDRKVGDLVTITVDTTNSGNLVVNVPEPNSTNISSEEKEIIEYDPQTRQFFSYDPAKIKVPEKINSEWLSADKKRKLKEGEVITLSDGTEVQMRTSDKNGLVSNRNALVVSVLLDGGLSYLLLTGIAKMAGIKQQEENKYSKGYIDALKEVEKQLERKQKSMPLDSGVSRDLHVVKQELGHAPTLTETEAEQLSKSNGFAKKPETDLIGIKISSEDDETIQTRVKGR